MNGMMNENVIVIIVREYEFDNPFIQQKNSLIDNSTRDFHNNLLIIYVIMI